MELLYLKDAYLKEFEAKVVEIENNKVVLDKTCFFVRSGGQPSDKGWINGIKVLDMEKEGERVFHVLEDLPNFYVGDFVKGKIDWNRRYRIMRLHTASHIISSVVWKNFKKAKFTGSQIYEDKARMDFNLEKLDSETVSFIEKEANKIVEENREVRSYFTTWEEVEKDPSLKRVEEVLYLKYKVPRIVEIVGIDKQLDGGTHVKNTSEVGRIRIVKRENKGKNNRRITIIVEP